MPAFLIAAPIISVVVLLVMLFTARQHRAVIAITIACMAFITGGFGHLVNAVMSL